MACCIAIALVIALIRKGWYALFPGRRPAEPGFAPAAYRAGPGAGATPPATDRDKPVPAPRPARRRVRRSGVLLIVAGTAWTGVTTLEMHVLHTLHLGHGPAGFVVHGLGLLLVGTGLLSFVLPARGAQRAAPHWRPAPEVIS